MNSHTARVTRIACPNCEAPVGKKCFLEGSISKHSLFFCFQRQEAIDKISPRSNLKMPPPSPRSFRANTLSGCKGPIPHDCKGFKRNHGVNTPCGCVCHKIHVVKSVVQLVSS